MHGTARYILLREGNGSGEDSVYVTSDGNQQQAFTPSFFAPYYALAASMENREHKNRRLLRAAAAVSMVAVMAIMCIGYARSGSGSATKTKGVQSELSTGSASWEAIYGSSDGDDSSSSSMGDMGDMDDDQSSALGDVTSSGSSSGSSSASDSTSFYDSMGGTGSGSSSLDSGDDQSSSTDGRQSDGSASNTQSLSGSRRKSRHSEREKKVKVVHNPNSVGSKLLKLSKEFDNASGSSSDKTRALKNLAIIQKELTSDYKKVLGLGHAAKKAAESMGLPKEKATGKAQLGGDPWSI